MRKALMIAVRVALVTLLLCGFAYPLAVWAVASAVFPHKAGGSLVQRDGSLVGSALIGQTFESPRYFHSRPSAAGQGYDAMASGASNLGPTSAALAARVASDVAHVRATEAGVQHGDIPVDLVTASGSGLDPHISPAAARLQVARIAAARRVDPRTINLLVARHTEPRQLGFLGEPRVNVLELNLELDRSLR